jgi:uncharacterized protein (DUF433 family)
MKDHGNAAMGFNQDKTTHHFTMNVDGGAIDVAANDAADQASIGQVRQHLQEIAVAFKRGDFGKPQATHSELPPGVPVMQRLKDAITYTYSSRSPLRRSATSGPTMLWKSVGFRPLEVVAPKASSRGDGGRRMGALAMPLNYRDRIQRDPRVVGGEAVVRGTRVTLRTVLASLAEGATVEEILDDFPTLTADDVRAVIAFAAESAREDLPIPESPVR